MRLEALALCKIKKRKRDIVTTITFRVVKLQYSSHVFNVVKSSSVGYLLNGAKRRAKSALNVRNQSGLPVLPSKRLDKGTSNNGVRRSYSSKMEFYSIPIMDTGQRFFVK
jgi:hypothetical protein